MRRLTGTQTVLVPGSLGPKRRHSKPSRQGLLASHAVVQMPPPAWGRQIPVPHSELVVQPSPAARSPGLGGGGVTGETLVVLVGVAAAGGGPASVPEACCWRG